MGTNKNSVSRRTFLKTAGVLGGVALAGQAMPALASVTDWDNPIAGAFDMHVHSSPDLIGRSMDALQLVEKARQVGMRGLLLIHHQTMTLDWAYFGHKLYPDFEVFGGIALNYPVGGMNLAAVEAAIKFNGGRFASVKFPSQSAGHDLAEKAGKEDEYGTGPGLWIIDKAGNLVPEVMPILKLMAKNDLVLLTGHISPKEDLALIKAAKEAGVKKMVITHATSPAQNVSPDQQKQLAGMGAFIEHIALNHFSNRVKVEDTVKAIKNVGAAQTILSSDLGQPLNPIPPEGFKEWISLLMKAGVTQAEMDLMIRKNPAKLLGLEPFTPLT